MHPEDQSFRESGEFVTQMHNSWAKHNLTFKFHVLAGPFPLSSLPSVLPFVLLPCALIIGYLVITDDTFFLVADIARNSPRSYINLSSYLSAPCARIGQNRPRQCKRGEAKCFFEYLSLAFIGQSVRERSMLSHTNDRFCDFTELWIKMLYTRSCNFHIF